MNRIFFILIVLAIVAAGCTINPAVLKQADTAAAAAPAAKANTGAKDTVPEIVGADNLAPNGSFEDGLDGWTPFGTCQIEPTDKQAHDGQASAFVFGRLEKWQGIGMNVAEILEPGKTYYIYGWVYLPKGASAKINLTAKKVDDAGTKYTQVGAAKVAAKEWTRLAGTYTHELFGDPKEVTVYFEGADANVDFYVDNFAIGLVK